MIYSVKVLFELFHLNYSSSSGLKIWMAWDHYQTFVLVDRTVTCPTGTAITLWRSNNLTFIDRVNVSLANLNICFLWYFKSLGNCADLNATKSFCWLKYIFDKANFHWFFWHVRGQCTIKTYCKFHNSTKPPHYTENMFYWN